MPWKVGVSSRTLSIDGVPISSPAPMHSERKAAASGGSAKVEGQVALRPISQLIAESKQLSALTNSVLAIHGVEWVRSWLSTPPIKRAPWADFGSWLMGVLGRRGGLTVKWYQAAPGSPLGFYDRSNPGSIAVRADLDGIELLQCFAHEALHAEAHGKALGLRSESEIDSEAAQLVDLYLRTQ